MNKNCCKVVLMFMLINMILESSPLNGYGEDSGDSALMENSKYTVPTSAWSGPIIKRLDAILVGQEAIIKKLDGVLNENRALHQKYKEGK